jgi:hypothetical protein
MFKSTRNKGFQMTFDNDWTISVQFGYVNYCSNRNHPEGCEFNEHIEIVSSSDAEIAIWNGNGDWYDFENDQVKGYCSVEEVADWIEKVRKFEK